MSVKTHLDKAAAFIAVAESGDAKREAYAKAADEILSAQAEDPTLSGREVARRIGKGETWVRDLLRWRARADAQGLPFARTERQQRYDERKVPTQHEDRVEMAKKLLADPKVAKAAARTVLDTSTQAGRVLAQAAHDADREQRQKDAERNLRRREDKAMPLPAHMAKMVMQMNEWTRGLHALRDDLDGLPEGRGRELVAQAANDLAEESWWWADRLEPGKPKLRIIQG